MSTLLSEFLVVHHPYLLLLATVLVFAVEFLNTRYNQDFKLFLTTNEAERASLHSLRSSILHLRKRSNQLNSPATFAEYAKTQRALQKDLKSYNSLLQSIETDPARLHGLKLQAALQAPKVIIYSCLLILGWGLTILELPLSGLIFSPLYYTPLKWFLGELGMFAWIIVTSRFANSAFSWL